MTIELLVIIFVVCIVVGPTMFVIVLANFKPTTTVTDRTALKMAVAAQKARHAR